MKSPRFLYRDLGEPDQYTVAERIALDLWDSLPDEALRAAAAEGRLGNREQVRAEIERMLPDLRTRSKLREFFHEWLQTHHAHDATRDADKYPDFDAEVLTDLRTSLDLQLDELLWSDQATLQNLLLGDEIYLNGRLARIYGADLPEQSDFQKVSLSGQRRTGLLTHPLILTGFSYNAASSPIHRGVFMARNVLGRTLRAPNEAFTPLSPDLHPDLNTRERVELQTSDRACQTCHAMINPLGFSLEPFDAIGRYRTLERDRPIDASGGYETSAGALIDFQDAAELARYLVDSEETQAAFVRHMFHYFIKQSLPAYGPDAPEALRRKFVEHEFHVRRLLVELVATAALDSVPLD